MAPSKRYPRQQWDGDKLVKSIRASVDFAYDLTRKNEGKTVPYEGPQLTTLWLLSSGDNVRERFDLDSQEWQAEHGRDVMDLALGNMLHLGIEQGFRMMCDKRTELVPELDNIQELLDFLENPKASGNPEKDKDWLEFRVEIARTSLKRLRRHVEDPGLMFVED